MVNYAALVAASILIASMPAGARAGDAAAGERLVRAYGCFGCHGTRFEGGAGPKLLGIEHRRSATEIADAVMHPKAPMPDFALSATQTADIVTYLAGLDGGRSGSSPVATISPATPRAQATLTVHFPTPPKHATAEAGMTMAQSGMSASKVTLTPTSDPHVWRGVVHFSMGGSWTVVVTYDGKTMNVPVRASGAE